MKNAILFAAVVSIILTSCVKNEVTPDEEKGSNVISYQTVVGTLSRAGDITNKTSFPTNNTFGSFAYFVAGTGTWATNASDATTTLYINDEAISYHSTVSTPFPKDTWHAGAVHYWPKQGSLTFFAYTPKTITVTCGQTEGIKATDYDVNTYKNVDFMVADIAADKKQNATTYESNGVPTLFKHKLTQIGFTIKTTSDYTNGHSAGSYAAGDKVIELTNIVINSVTNKGTYTQLATEGWSGQSGTVNYTYFGGSGVTAKAVTTTATEAKNADAQTIVLPQTFANTDAPNITIIYTIKTYTDGTNFSIETVTETKKLYDLHSGSNNAWEMNKNITYGITIDLSSQVILWNPAVADWDNVNNGITI